MARGTRALSEYSAQAPGGGKRPPGAACGRARALGRRC